MGEVLARMVLAAAVAAAKQPTEDPSFLGPLAGVSDPSASAFEI
ncbi:MAG: hypothetical protein U0610_26175 [bacterium]